MLGPTHRAIGVITSSCVLLLGHDGICAHVPDCASVVGACEVVALTTIGAYLGSSLPDIDKKLLTHRGITHTLWAILVLAYACFASRQNGLVFAFLSGLTMAYALHVVCDAFSTAGIAWLYPFQQYKRYASGAFHVKGFRGPFVPLYTVGDPAYKLVPKVGKLVAWGLVLAAIARYVAGCLI